MSARDEVIAELLSDILRSEGWPQYTNRPADRGGPTKGGITLHTLSAWRGRPCSIADLLALSIGEAQNIYLQRYIQPWEFIPDDKLFAVCVDYAVTSWHDNPARALQAAVGTPVDGIVGPLTRRAILFHGDFDALRHRVLAHRLRKVVDLALDDHKLKALIAGHDDLQLLNLRGWVNRITNQM